MTNGTSEHSFMALHEAIDGIKEDLPFLGGAMVTRTGRWDLNFYLIAALLAAGALVWTRWASGEAITPAPARPSAAPWLAPPVRPAP